MIPRLALLGLQAATARVRRKLERETAGGQRPPLRPETEALNVLMLSKYPEAWAGTKYRLGVWAERLRAAGHEVRVDPALPSPDAERLTGDFSVSARWEYHRALLRRRVDAVRAAAAHDVVVLHMTDLPFWEYGEPFVARALARAAPRVLLDLDDLPLSGGEHTVGARTRALVESVDGLIGGNPELLDELPARPAWIVPTCVEPAEWTVPDRTDRDGPVVLGWVGTIGNARYLEALAPVLARVCAAHGARVRFVGGRPPELPGVPVDFVPWTAAGETRDLLPFDIGLAPLPDRLRQRCKCGLKALQYMAAGLPVVASPVGALGRIVRDGETGLHATSSEEWEAALGRLIADHALRTRMGSAGRDVAARHWSFEAHHPRFEDALRGRSPERGGGARPHPPRASRA